MPTVTKTEVLTPALKALELGLVPAVVPTRYVMFGSTGLLKLGPPPFEFRTTGPRSRYVPVGVLRHLSPHPTSKKIALLRETIATVAGPSSWASHSELWVSGAVETEAIVWTWPWLHLALWKELEGRVEYFRQVTDLRPGATGTVMESVTPHDWQRLMHKQREVLDRARAVPLRDKVLEVAEAQLAMDPDSLFSRGFKAWLRLKDKSVLRIP